MSIWGKSTGGSGGGIEEAPVDGNQYARKDAAWAAIVAASYSRVNTFANLPSASSATDEIYVVISASGLWPFNRKPAGMYYSNGTSWEYMSAYPELLKDVNFGIQNGTDLTKIFKFDASGITTETTATLTVPNKNGTLAMLDDIPTVTLNTAYINGNLITTSVTDGAVTIKNGTASGSNSVLTILNNADETTASFVGDGTLTCTNVSGMNTGDQTATTVPFTPYGELDSTNVQDALEEVDGLLIDKATQFPGICATTPITANDISIDYTTRVLTIIPPLGYFHFFTDGNGVVTHHVKTGNVSFPAFTDTSGIWNFYFNNAGDPIVAQGTFPSFSQIAAVYRLFWNNTLTGSAKSVVESIETHLNTISASDHQWKHTQGTIWRTGGEIINNALTTGLPNADGRNTCVSVTDVTNIDDNLEYTVLNNTSGLVFTQDLGNTNAGALTSSNSGQFIISYRDAAGLIELLPATRFPFPFNATTNHPEYITTLGVRTSVTSSYYFVVYGGI